MGSPKGENHDFQSSRSSPCGRCLCLCPWSKLQKRDVAILPCQWPRNPLLCHFRSQCFRCSHGGNLPLHRPIFPRSRGRCAGRKHVTQGQRQGALTTRNQEGRAFCRDMRCNGFGRHVDWVYSCVHGCRNENHTLQYAGLFVLDGSDYDRCLSRLESYALVNLWAKQKYQEDHQMSFEMAMYLPSRGTPF